MAIQTSFSPQFEQNAGYNPNQHATADTATTLANALGGQTTQTRPGGPLAPPPQQMVDFGGGSVFNAGLLGQNFANNPMAKTMLMDEMKSANSGGIWNDPGVRASLQDPRIAAATARYNQGFNQGQSVPGGEGFDSQFTGRSQADPSMALQALSSNPNGNTLMGTPGGLSRTQDQPQGGGGGQISPFAYGNAFGPAAQHMQAVQAAMNSRPGQQSPQAQSMFTPGAQGVGQQAQGFQQPQMGTFGGSQGFFQGPQQNFGGGQNFGGYNPMAAFQGGGGGNSSPFNGVSQMLQMIQQMRGGQPGRQPLQPMRNQGFTRPGMRRSGQARGSSLFYPQFS